MRAGLPIPSTLSHKEVLAWAVCVMRLPCAVVIEEEKVSPPDGSDFNEREVQRLRSEFREVPFIAHLGLELSDIGRGWAETELVVAERHAQAQGLVHAGVLATMVDHTAGASGWTLAPPGSAVVTVEFKINLLRPASGGRLVCRAEVIKPGRMVTVVEARVHSHRDAEAKLCAIATVTLAAVPAP